ncbi:MAG: FAD-dependent oxidoreductase, partial [Gammaproteobacteria bacterium]|nr:FAD-dependent oxidoreductase [Gammaproteobacteria bacterium]
GLPAGTDAMWHERAGWVRPAHLVRAWLAQPGIQVETGRSVAQLVQRDAGVELHDADGAPIGVFDRVVIAAGHDSRRFAPHCPLQPVRGQIAWGPMRDARALPSTPINGDGYFIALPDAEEPIWVAGATFDRDACDTTLRAADTEDNARRLARLHPAAAEALSAEFSAGDARAWAGVRCASGDRRPLIGPIDANGSPSIWLCTALGSRGLSFAALCGELLAARWHAEPLPLPTALARALDTRRI